MPAKNTVRDYQENSYYHVFNKGLNKNKIFKDHADYEVFIGMLKRYLGQESSTDQYGRPYPNYHSEVDLVAFNLLPQHFHLLLHQKNNSRSIEAFMRSLVTAYTRYYNTRYKRTGHVFQGTFKAAKLQDESHLLPISHYIHANVKDFKDWQYSSWPYFTKGWMADWVKQHKVFELFEGGNYEHFTDGIQYTKEHINFLKSTVAQYA